VQTAGGAVLDTSPSADDERIFPGFSTWRGWKRMTGGAGQTGTYWGSVVLGVNLPNGSLEKSLDGGAHDLNAS
jgi:hypothetical protein